MRPILSVIIPTINEVHNLPRTLTPLFCTPQCEVVVIDGGSSDGTVEFARTNGCRTFSGPRGRGVQLNLGCRESRGELLLFLHGDTLVPDNFIELVTRTLSMPGVAAGAFSLGFDSRRRAMALISCGANLRSRIFTLPYGDQGLFTSRTNFLAVGGFTEMEIMEDYVFVKKMRRCGRIITLREQVITSARRWDNMGILKTTLINQVIIVGYRLGVPPPTLACWYQRARGLGRGRDDCNNS